MSGGGNTLRQGMEPRDCPVCGLAAVDGRVVHEERLDPARLDGFAFAARKLPEFMHWRLTECGRCGVLFANPAPSPQALAAAYRDARYDSGDEAGHAASTYARLLRPFVVRLPERSALDVGAGDGAFLAVLRALGFDDIVGIEPSLAPLATADPQIRPLIRQDIYRPDDFESERFGLVSCLHTVEHLPDPLTAFRGFHRSLRDGGALLVACHDRRAPLNRMLGSRSPIYDVEHLQLFCPNSLRALLERTGFRDVEIRPYSNRYPVRYWTRLAPVGEAAKGRMLALLERTSLASIPVRLPVGNLAAVAWKRSPGTGPAQGSGRRSVRSSPA